MYVTISNHQQIVPMHHGCHTLIECESAMSESSKDSPYLSGFEKVSYHIVVILIHYNCISQIERPLVFGGLLLFPPCDVM